MEILAHGNGRYGNIDGRLDPTLRMHKIVHMLNGVEKEIFLFDRFTGWESFTVHICINMLQDLSKYAQLQCSLLFSSLSDFDSFS